MPPLIPTSLIIYLSCLLCAVLRLIDLAGVGYDISVGGKKAEILDLLCRKTVKEIEQDRGCAYDVK